MFQLFVSLYVALFSVINPLGATPVFLAMTPHQPATERKKVALHTSLYVIGILLTFFWVGSYILAFFGITLDAMRIAGGLVILNSGFALLNGGGDRYANSRAVDEEVRNEAQSSADISFSPLAMPLLSGPGSIALLIGMYSQYPQMKHKLLICGVIVALGLSCYLILRAAPQISKRLGASGMNAVSRIMGFLTMSTGVQMIIIGVYQLVKHSK